MPEEPKPAVSLGDVLDAERKEIEEVRERRRSCVESFNPGVRRDPTPAPKAPISGRASAAEPEWQTRDKDAWVDVIQKAHDANLVGLAFSGGGIRSATFNLGVLQALADLKLLYRIDYLSTVSGGGFIGGWLAAWTKRLENFAEVQKRLAPNRVHQEEDREPTPIRFLRVFSNYLTPKLGIFSGDTWVTVGIYLRNMLLNQTVVFALLALILLVPRAVEAWAIDLRQTTWLHYWWLWQGAAIVLLVIALYTVAMNMEYLDRRDGGKARHLTTQAWILGRAAAPLFAAAALAAMWLVVRSYGNECLTHYSYPVAAMLGAGAYGGIWTIAKLAELVRRQRPTPPVAATTAHAASPTERPPQNDHFFITLLGAIGAGALAGWLYALLSGWMLCWRVSDALTAGAPLVMGIFLLAGILHIGLMGNAFHDRKREWWGRLGGWLILWGLVWLAIFWVALYFPDFYTHGWLVSAAKKAIVAKCLTPTWIATTVGGVLAGKSKDTGKPGTLTWKDVLAKVAPYVFVVGLMCWISWGIQAIQDWKLLAYCTWIADHRLLAAMVGCAAAAVIMALRVDVNQFSMHLFYRNRLVRCYLGASNKGRAPNRFTGFDRTDDLHLKDLIATKNYDGPYPILNASLNLVKGKDLAFQERKAESFVMTPLYCGYDVWLEEQDSPIMRGERMRSDRGTKETPSVLRRWLGILDHYGYRPTENYAFPPPFTGPDLGLAMGISGAAASPNMGSYSSTPVAFLMTVFNVRLGQWLGNPRNRRTYRRATPIFGLPYLVNELLAGTDDESAYVYLSDGGHFENMALYELVKRRCGLIIVCDAEADGGYGFGGIGNAIRKCRIDLGIDICLDVSEIAPKKSSKPSKKHCSVGQIHYEQVDMNAPMGTIIYFKASLTDDEPTDVKNYKKTSVAFPHESTIDQWFSESQFECYRKLGYHEVVTSLQPSGATGGAAAAVSKGRPDGASDSASKKKDRPPKEALDHQLRRALDDFGFDLSKLPKAGEDANC